MNHDDILKEKSRLDRERGVKLREFLKEYDSRVYDPAVKRLRENCEKLGHKYSYHGYNFVRSHTIYKCNHCGISKHEENQ
jgi:hypothetical protein